LTALVGGGVFTAIVGTGVESGLFANGVGDRVGSCFGVTDDRTGVGDGAEKGIGGLGATAAVGAAVGTGVTSVRRLELPMAPATRSLSFPVLGGRLIDPEAICVPARMSDTMAEILAIRNKSPRTSRCGVG
jgi:hypothetical protein